MNACALISAFLNLIEDAEDDGSKKARTNH